MEHPTFAFFSLSLYSFLSLPLYLHSPIKRRTRKYCQMDNQNQITKGNRSVFWWLFNNRLWLQQQISLSWDPIQLDPGHPIWQRWPIIQMVLLYSSQVPLLVADPALQDQHPDPRLVHPLTIVRNILKLVKVTRLRNNLSRFVTFLSLFRLSFFSFSCLFSLSLSLLSRLFCLYYLGEFCFFHTHIFSRIHALDTIIRKLVACLLLRARVRPFNYDSVSSHHICVSHVSLFFLPLSLYIIIFPCLHKKFQTWFLASLTLSHSLSFSLTPLLFQTYSRGEHAPLYFSSLLPQVKNSKRMGWEGDRKWKEVTVFQERKKEKDCYNITVLYEGMRLIICFWWWGSSGWEYY